MPENNELSQREIEILSLVANGASNKEIAHDLNISTNTVKVHLRNIFTKIEVNSRTEAAMHAVNAGIVDVRLGNSAAGQVEAPSGTNYRTVFGLVGGAVVILLMLIGILASQGFFSGAQSDLDQPVIPVEEGWQQKADLITPRKGLAVTSYDGEIFTFAGETSNGITDAAERYDPAADQWLVLEAKPTPVTDVAAAVIGGRIYIPGGLTPSGEVSEALEIYSPIEDNWQQGADLPLGISAYALAAYEGNLYLFGGWDGENYLDSVYQYDPALDQWSQKTPMSSQRGYAGAAISGGKIYVLGGYDGRDSLSSMEIYIPELDGTEVDPWSLGPALPASRYQMGVAGLGNMIHVVGGEIGAGGAQSSILFSPQDQIWQEFDSPTDSSITGLGLVPLESHLFLVGGEINEQISAKSIAYQAIYTFVMPIIR